LKKPWHDGRSRTDTHRRVPLAARQPVPSWAWPIKLPQATGLIRRTAFTLVEIVAAWFLLAVLLTGALLAYSGHQRQLLRAEQQLAAVNVADALVAQWSASPTSVPRWGRGVLPGKPGWIWRTAIVRRTSLEHISFDVVRLELFAAGQKQPQPAAQVEMLFPTQPPPAPPQIPARRRT